MSDEAMKKLTEGMRAMFSDTELHAFMITASQPGARQYQHWQRLGYAATVAASCSECPIHTMFHAPAGVNL